MKTKKTIQSMYQKILLKDIIYYYIEEEDKEHYVFIKEFDVFIFDHTLTWWTQHFCFYCLQAFSTADTLKIHVNDCFKINSKQMIKMPKRAKYVRLQNCERKIK